VYDFTNYFVSITIKVVLYRQTEWQNSKTPKHCVKHVSLSIVFSIPDGMKEHRLSWVSQMVVVRKVDVVVTHALTIS